MLFNETEAILNRIATMNASASDNDAASAASQDFNDQTESVVAVVTTTDTEQLILSDAVMKELYIYVFISLCGCLAIFGVVSNVINMTVFVKLGLKDSMAVCLFSLSLADLCLSALTTVDRAFPIWNFFYHNEGVDPRAVFYVSLAWITDSLFLCSGCIITVMSVERCVCVVFPFKVRTIFTRSRAVVVVVVIYLSTILSYVPLYMTQWLGWVEVPVPDPINGTRIASRMVVIFSRDRKEIQSYVSIFSAAILQFPSMILTLGSVILMIYGLNASSKIRQEMTSASKMAAGAADGEEKSRDSKLNAKTRTLVKMVLFLAVIFMIASVPRVIAVCIKLFFPEISEDGRQRNLNDFQWQIGRLLSTLNASVNIFVYLKINTAYREKFRELLPMFRENG